MPSQLTCYLPPCDWVCSYWFQSCPVTHLPLPGPAVIGFLSPLLLAYGRLFSPIKVSSSRTLTWPLFYTVWSGLWYHRVYLGCHSAREYVFVLVSVQEILSTFLHHHISNIKKEVISLQPAHPMQYVAIGHRKSVTTVR